MPSSTYDGFGQCSVVASQQILHPPHCPSSPNMAITTSHSYQGRCDVCRCRKAYCFVQEWTRTLFIEIQTLWFPYLDSRDIFKTKDAPLGGTFLF